MIKKNYLIFLFLLFTTLCSYSQNHITQNGLKTSVINNLIAPDTQAKRYEIASIGYNSHHWQAGGLLIIELFQISYGTGYEKYILENGFFQGANSGSPAIKLVESQGIFHSGKIVLGTPTDLTTSIGDKVNRELPILFDVRYYANYLIKITYLQEKVDVITGPNQVKINQTPVGINIPDFSVTNALNTNLTITGIGNHYIQNGNVGIGTTSPKNKLDVNGTIRSKEVKVTLDNWSDFVFKKEYNLPTLEQVEKHITEKGHLENIPSEEEVLKNGINLGEINAKLLQKIEELTLYMIEMKKENEKQDKKIKSLENKLQK
ncbi:hypothetical protein [Flavobacterium branchiicola]|uniref:Uncharacterized protein n=1 Tax=Flavobacterium branchiicola TaxID=1114875 RepID=A0ABV9PNP8_9FLAO|nr:hypothetical protein [Flavobacterium branchiicola]MBS7256723.1 hypothetical protein [Flavobacterium branchiicola]